MSELYSFPFRHRYHKLGLPRFTTIRGVSAMKKVKAGDTVECETPDGTFKATVASVVTEKVKNLGVEFLNADASYKGFTINTIENFVDLLNSFRAPAWGKVTEDSEMAVFTLQKEIPTAKPFANCKPRSEWKKPVRLLRAKVVKALDVGSGDLKRHVFTMQADGVHVRRANARRKTERVVPWEKLANLAKLQPDLFA